MVFAALALCGPSIRAAPLGPFFGAFQRTRGPHLMLINDLGSTSTDVGSVSISASPICPTVRFPPDSSAAQASSNGEPAFLTPEVFRVTTDLMPDLTPFHGTQQHKTASSTNVTLTRFQAWQRTLGRNDMKSTRGVLGHSLTHSLLSSWGKGLFL